MISCQKRPNGSAFKEKFFKKTLKIILSLLLRKIVNYGRKHLRKRWNKPRKEITTA